MKRFPFAPGTLQGGSRFKARLARVRRWLVRHSDALGLVLILTAFAGWCFGLEGWAMWLLLAASFGGVLGLERLERADDRRALEDL
ncbi:MAG: hypothetical protein QM617_05030 [Comamonas sp.]